MNEQRQHLPHQSTACLGAAREEEVVPLKASRGFRGKPTMPLCHTSTGDTPHIVCLQWRAIVLNGVSKLCSGMHARRPKRAQQISIQCNRLQQKNVSNLGPPLQNIHCKSFTAPTATPEAVETPAHRELSRQIMLNSHNPDRKTAYTGGLWGWGDVKITKDYRRGKEKSARKGDTKWSWLVDAEQREICTT